MKESEYTDKYDDIIMLEHPTSSRHPRMSIHDRAAQFSAFAALTGYDAMVDKTSLASMEDTSFRLADDWDME